MNLLRELYFFDAKNSALFEQLTHLQQKVDSLVVKIIGKPLAEATDLDFSKNNMTLPNLKINIEKLQDMLVNAFKGLEQVGQLPNEQARNKHARAIGDNIRRIDARLKTLEDEYHHYVSQRVANVFDQGASLPAAPAEPEVRQQA